MAATTIIGTFDPVELWRTKSGEVFTDKKLGEFRARKDGDSDPMSGGYPVGPEPAGTGYRRREDGQIFMIRSLTGDRR